MSELSIVAIIQARMNSTRLPGKVLTPLNGKPLLEHITDSLANTFAPNDIYIATSSNVENQDIVEYCISRNLKYHQGDEVDVASRFVSILEKSSCDYFVRLNGDSPLLDYRIVEDGLNLLNSSNSELITTVSSAPFPSGMNCEIIKSSTFLDAYKKFSKPEHFEHVTRFFYENSSSFSISHLLNPVSQSTKYKFAIDTSEDQTRIVALMKEFSQPHYMYTFEEKCNIYKELFL